MSAREPTSRAFLALAIPNILSNLAVPLAGLIDMALLGHLDDITPLAGVALGALIFDYIYMCFNFLRMGATGLTAEAHGAGDEAETMRILARSLLLAGVIGAVIIASQALIAAVGFNLLDGGAAVEAQARAYFHARVWGAPANLGLFAVLGWLLGRGRSKQVLLTATTVNGLNIVFDYWFIIELGWGARGAGLATMLADVTALGVALVLVWREWKRSGAPLPRWAEVMERKAFRAMLGLHGNIMIRTFCLISSFAMFTNISAVMGAAVLAGNALLLRFLSTAAYFIDGFAFALETFAGRYAGAGRWLSVRRALGLALGWNMVAVLLFVALFLAAGRSLLGLMTEHVEVVDFADGMVPYLAGALLLSGVAYILDGLFIGLTRGTLLRNAMLASTLVGFLPMALWARTARSPDLLWGAMICFMLARALTLALPAWRLPREEGV